MTLRLALECLLVSLIVLDLFAARALMRSGWFTQGQIIAQILIVLFVPLFGAIFALVFLRSQPPGTRA